MYLHDPRAERALILSVTDDPNFAAAVAAARTGLPTSEGGWLDVAAPGIVDRAEQRAIKLAAEILDLAALAPRLRGRGRPALTAGVRDVVRSAHAAFAACRALGPFAQSADAMEEVAR